MRTTGSSKLSVGRTPLKNPTLFISADFGSLLYLAYFSYIARPSRSNEAAERQRKAASFRDDLLRVTPFSLYFYLLRTKNIYNTRPQLATVFPQPYTLYITS
jgi:hypothetical protein